jgi:hypothetical protein
MRKVDETVPIDVSNKTAALHSNIVYNHMVYFLLKRKLNDLLNFITK